MLLYRKLIYDHIRVGFCRRPLYRTAYAGTVNNFKGQRFSMESNAVSVRTGENDELRISFYYNGELKDFNRKKTEAVGKTLQRIALKLQPKTKKKKKKKDEPNDENSPEALICCVMNGDVKVDEELSNEESFRHGGVLEINSTRYSISVNQPTVTQLTLPAYIMAGFPIIPNVKFERADVTNSTFKWLKCPSPNESSDWMVVGEDSTFTPSVDEIDFYLKCVCSPGDGDVMGPFNEETVSEDSIKAGPGICLFDERHLYTSSYHAIDSSHFRFITFNVLANMLADTDYARTELFPFCPPYAIKADYRRQLLFKELTGYRGDIICLQECTIHEFENYFEHWMILHGYNGFLKTKLGEMSEGEALFYRNERYLHVADFSTSIEDALFSEENKSLLKSISCSPSLLEALLTKKNIGQIHLLKEIHGEGRYICVLNTHLFYKRHGSHIRLLQIAVLMNHMRNVLDSYEEDILVIVAGDFNALQGEPLLAYLAGARINEEHGVWRGCYPPLDESDFAIDLKCPVHLRSLSGFPEFTSYVPHCKATLDYIFGDDRVIKKEQFVPIPKASDIEVYTGVPCVVYPSDHFAVVLDLKWVDENSSTG